MKFFSLFTKTPTHQRFNYTPRYYDPKKEEMAEREARIRRELKLEREKEADLGDYRSRITGSFQAARKRSKKSGDTLNSSLLRLGILLFLVLFIIAYIQWGQIALYGLVLFVPFYFYLKFKKR
ncbi:MAG TPA: hypothetical protein PKJ63_02390 [Cyclobacteriaceae bacterium]|nr:hypothetical protein [Cyclobacteriaceae bacterium]